VGLVRGDVELHIKQADWNSHGHGGDPNYNGVVVHGALEVFSEETRLQNGSFAPVMDLQALLTETPLPEDSEAGTTFDLWQVLSRKGFFKPDTLDEAKRTLDRAGDDRFRAKASWLAQCIQSDGPDQALYQVLMEGMGYSSNRVPFVQLASFAPYETLSAGAGNGHRRVADVLHWFGRSRCVRQAQAQGIGARDGPPGMASIPGPAQQPPEAADHGRGRAFGSVSGARIGGGSPGRSGEFEPTEPYGVALCRKPRRPGVCWAGERPGPGGKRSVAFSSRLGRGCA